MNRSQQIIAVYDAVPAALSPVGAVRKAIEALTEGPSPIFVAIDHRRPYPIGDFGPPDWLIASIVRDDPAASSTGWRAVIDASPHQTRTVLLSYGEITDVPRSVVQKIELGDWTGDPTDQRLQAVAGLMVGRTSAWNHAAVERDALDRGALVHVGDGTTMLNPQLLARIDELGLSKVTVRILRDDNMIFVGDLVQHTEVELLRFPDLGRKRLGEIREALKALGLVLGATIPGWPPEDIETAVAGAGTAEILARTHQVPSGEMFTAVADRLVIDPAAGGRSDRDAGAAPITMQLQESVRRKLEALRPVALRLGNQPEWHALAPLCDRIAALLDRRGAEIPEVLGSLYGAALELGSFAEMDQGAREDPRSTVDPLDGVASRTLQDVLTGMAPWLRRFPTIRDLDDEAGRFLFARTTSGSARDAIAAAAETDLIPDADAAGLNALLDAGDRGGFVGAKAGRRGLLSIRNLVLAAASLIAQGMWDAAVSEYAAHSVVAKRAGAMLVRAEQAVIAIASELPADVRIAVRRTIDDARAAASGAHPGPKSNAVRSAPVISPKLEPDTGAD